MGQCQLITGQHLSRRPHTWNCTLPLHRFHTARQLCSCKLKWLAARPLSDTISTSRRTANMAAEGGQSQDSIAQCRPITGKYGLVSTNHRTPSPPAAAPPTWLQEEANHRTASLSVGPITGQYGSVSPNHRTASLSVKQSQDTISTSRRTASMAAGGGQFTRMIQKITRRL
jgi:hypothetical protein